MGFMKNHFHEKLEEGGMKATTLPDQPDVNSPAGADIRFLIEGEKGTMIHCTLPPHQMNRALVHAAVSEFYTCWKDTVRSGETMAGRAPSLIKRIRQVPVYFE
jgi:hypothetical protein